MSVWNLFLKNVCLRFRTRHAVPLTCFSTTVTLRKKTIDTMDFYREKNPPQDIWADRNDPKFTKVEEVHGHWHYVERLFPKLVIPKPSCPSSTGWRPPPEVPPDLPYFIQRSRNYMLPVYQDRVYKERVLVTSVRHVHGDIWLFEHDLKKYLNEKFNTEVQSHVNEIGCFVNIGGDYIDAIKDWLYELGF